jgi:hypothetical protein
MGVSRGGLPRRGEAEAHMYTEVRIALVLVALAVAALAAWLAWPAVVDNLAALRSWTRTEGRVYSVENNRVEIEFGTDPETRRVWVPADHQFFLPEYGVQVYVDPADPARARMAGLLQMWLRPAALALIVAAFLGLALAAARVGRGDRAAGYGRGHWTLSTPPPPLQTEVRVYRPASEWKAPLFWSVLGLGAAALGLFAPAVTPLARIGYVLLGGLWIVLTASLSLYNGTTQVAADAHGLLETSAFGWRDLRWEEVGGVETRELVPTTRRNFSEAMPFPGRTTRSLVFTDRDGRALMRLSVAMQPRDDMRRLLEVCAARTGLHEQFRQIKVPDL